MTTRATMATGTMEAGGKPSTAHQMGKEMAAQTEPSDT